MLRTLARGVGWTALAVALLFAAWVGINATDEDLSPEARAMMALPPPPEPSERNGYLDFLALGAVANAPTYEIGLSRLRELNEGKTSRFPIPPVKIDARIPLCRPAESPCLDDAAAHPGLQALIEGQSPFVERYRAMREKPEFIELLVPPSPDTELPGYKELFDGSRLSLLAAAIRFNAGEREGAIREVERESSFHRRVAVGSRLLIQKMVACALMDRDALFIVEMSRKIPARNSIWPRIEALVRESQEEYDFIPVLNAEFAHTIESMKTRRYVRLSDAYYEVAQYVPGARTTRPWWDPVAPFLYRPHHSVNLFAARGQVMLELAKSPASEFFKSRELAATKLGALEPGVLAAAVLNPVGSDHELLKNYMMADYVARLHVCRGVQTLARLIVSMRATGISKPDELAAALAGPLGRAHPDPFTGKPMRLDPKAGTVGFDTVFEVKIASGAVRPLLERYGRLALLP